MAGFWQGRRVLLTGHTGFKGAWLALWLERMGARVTGLSLAPEDGALWSRVGGESALESHIGDIRDPEAVASAVAAARPEIILHLAAQALVRRSYADPEGTYSTNVQGTVNVLQAARRAEGLKAVLVVTSDKVYKNLNQGVPFAEDSPLGGHDPYSASKACTELVTASLRDSFLRGQGVCVATARAGNVIGGGDMAEDRLVPDFIRALGQGQPLKVRNPSYTRPWQHVLEPLRGYLMYAQAMVERPVDLPEALNFGPLHEEAWPVRAVVDTMIAELGRGGWVQDGAPSVAEAKLLSLDASLAARALAWRPVLDVDTGIRWTMRWWRDVLDGTPPRVACERQIDEFVLLGNPDD